MSRSSVAPTSASPRSSTPSSAPSGWSSPSWPGRPATRSTPSWTSTAAGWSWSTPPGFDAAPRSPGTVAYYAQLRSERAAERADVALVVCDASEGVTSEDLRVAELAMRSGCATLVALNKWDIGETDLEDATRAARQAPAPASAGRHVLGAHAVATAEAARACDRARRSARLADPDARAEPLRPGPAGQQAAAARRGRRLRLYYAAQVGRRPPRFAIQVNDRRLITREWAFHLENRLREDYGLQGVPLVIDFIPHTRRSRRARPGLAAQSQ